MAEAPLVGETWRDIESLRGLLDQLSTKPLTEAVFVNDEGDWRFVAALPDVDVTGTRPIYAALDEAAEQNNVDFALLSRLVLLDAADADAQTLTYAKVSPSAPPRQLDVTLPSLPGYAGAVLRRDARLERVLSGRRLEEEVLSELQAQGLNLIERGERLDIGWRADFIVYPRHGDHVQSARRFIVEVVIADRRSVKTRIRDAAGMANVAGCPVILVMSSPEPGALELQASYGVVPVLTVDWERQGAGRLRETLAEAARWIDDHSIEV